MDQIDYETPQYSSKRQKGGQKESFFIGLILRTGLVKDKKQANMILLAMAGVFFLATLIVLSINGIFNSSGNSNEDTNYKDYAGSEYMIEENVDI